MYIESRKKRWSRLCEVLGNGSSKGKGCELATAHGDTGKPSLPKEADEKSGMENWMRKYKEGLALVHFCRL